MKNRFKFRVWDKSENDFITHVYRGFDRPNIYLTLDGKIEWQSECGEGQCNNIVIQQWTGYKDKDGAEIYEGDIIKVTGDYFLSSCDLSLYDKAEIRWLSGGFSICQVNLGAVGLEEIIFCHCCNLGVKIIGNIFQNKELLK